MVKWSDYITASKELSPAGLKLYMYLAKNQDGYILNFSSKDYCETFGVVDKTFRNARAELLQRGYLKEDKEGRNVYFDATGAYKETKESLQQELKNLYDRINLLSEKDGDELRVVMGQAKLKEITNENEYKSEIKKVISFAEEMLIILSSQAFKNLI